MKPRLPAGAQEIWDLRLQKKKPNSTVFVSLIGELPNEMFQVLVAPTQRFEELEWRWVRDLSVCVVHHETTPPKRVADLSQMLVRLAPNGGFTRPFSPSFGYLWQWNAAQQDGYLLSWWQGHQGIPELEIADQPEEIEIAKMSRYERHVFMGVGA